MIIINRNKYRFSSFQFLFSFHFFSIYSLFFSAYFLFRFFFHFAYFFPLFQQFYFSLIVAILIIITIFVFIFSYNCLSFVLASMKVQFSCLLIIFHLLYSYHFSLSHPRFFFATYFQLQFKQLTYDK